MAIPEHLYKEMKKIMLFTTLQSIGITAGIVAVVLVAAYIFKFQITVSPITIIFLTVGTLMAVIGNNFVMNATTRFNAKDTILWKWGNRVQAIGFMLTLVAAFL